MTLKTGLVVCQRHWKCHRSIERIWLTLKSGVKGHSSGLWPWPLTLKVVSESRVMWATAVPTFVFLGLSVLDLGPMYATDRQTGVRQKHHSMPPPIRVGAKKRRPTDEGSHSFTLWALVAIISSQLTAQNIQAHLDTHRPTYCQLPTVDHQAEEGACWRALAAVESDIRESAVTDYENVYSPMKANT